MIFDVLNVMTDETAKLNAKIDVMNIIIFYFILPLYIHEDFLSQFVIQEPLELAGIIVFSLNSHMKYIFNI
jgi:hypothetical protein